MLLSVRGVFGEREIVFFMFLCTSSHVFTEFPRMGLDVNVLVFLVVKQ